MKDPRCAIIQFVFLSDSYTLKTRFGYQNLHLFLLYLLFLHPNLFLAKHFHFPKGELKSLVGDQLTRLSSFYLSTLLVVFLILQEACSVDFHLHFRLCLVVLSVLANVVALRFVLPPSSPPLAHSLAKLLPAVVLPADFLASFAPADF